MVTKYLFDSVVNPQKKIKIVIYIYRWFNGTVVSEPCSAKVHKKQHGLFSLGMSFHFFFFLLTYYNKHVKFPIVIDWIRI